MSIIYTGNANWNSYLQALQKHIIYPRFKCVLLNWDNTDNIDISDYMTQNNSSLTVNFQNGVRRACQIEFYNDLTGLLLTNPNGLVWGNTKIKLYLGLALDPNDEDVVYFPAGVFLLKEPQFTSNFSNQTILYDGVDLFGLFDDTISGVLDTDFQLDSTMTFLTAVKNILAWVGDTIPPLISNTYINSETTTKVSRTIGDKISDVCSDAFPRCNYYYNIDGQFQLDDGIYDLDDSTKGTIYDFYDTNDNQYFGCIKTDMFDKLRNKVIIDANNLSSSSSTTSASIIGTAINNSPLSDFCVNHMSINLNNPKPRILYKQDNNITDQTTADQKAAWELKRNLISARTYTLYTSYIPHLDVNQVITVTDQNLGLIRERMLITQINIPIQTDSKMTISCSSTNEILFNM